MAKQRPRRCAFKDGQRRCSRNGFGNPPLCRAHAIQLNLNGREVEIDEGSSIFSFIEMADRALSKNKSSLVKEMGAIFGQYLSNQAAGRAARAQVPFEASPPPPPPPPRPQPVEKENPRDVLGFSPDEPLDPNKIKQRKRALAALFHPDKGGSQKAMQRVNDAADALLAEIA